MSAEIERLRRMIDDVQSQEYSDETLTYYLELAHGDLNQVAGEIWAEKAMKLTLTHYNFSADGASYDLGEVIEQAKRNSQYYMSKRKARTSRWIKDPPEVEDAQP
ncbi:hypothetical protein ATHL_01990 [Anaerolinea thermolimosa]|uniref:hypothetical protein n=1 Tax=Anaerolinea thermolimosa TaxID=229919 RepID=UPI0007858406|nr:hypothetical protein [Anaerolinea thermolimosa]GAP07122.1 hypothetical protein ATHL_01990 [Anaerolinea thermolimosa]